MGPYYPTIGLEVHAELNTKSKMFCPCANDPFHAPGPNTHICPVCMAHPGSLPVPNLEAMRSVVMMGLSIGGSIANFTEFDRKSYFYPDIPKGYQISQYKYPIVSGGQLAGVAITRVHLEEDTATNEHGVGNNTLVDFNRAGVPLMELVTEPVIQSAEQAMMFGRELQLLLRYLGISDAHMEMGQMRVEVNISLSPDPHVFGTKVEIKNLSSFSVVGKAIEYELARMQNLYELGRQEEIVQETRTWNEYTSTTVPMRTKENAQDYRYFPDPDIPKFMLYELFDFNELRSLIPELPSEKRLRYAEMYGIKSDDIDVLVANPKWSTYFENTMIELGGKRELAQLAANYILTDMVGLATELGEGEVFTAIEVSDMAELVTMINMGELSSRGAKDILRLIVTEGGNPRTLADKHELVQKNDDEVLLGYIREAISSNPNQVAEYRSGKEPVIMFLVGQAMKLSRGSANPSRVTELMKAELTQ